MQADRPNTPPCFNLSDWASMIKKRIHISKTHCYSSANKGAK